MVQKAGAVPGECGLSAGRLVYAHGEGEGTSSSGREVVKVNVGIAVHVRGPGYEFSVGRKIAAGNFPLVLSEPVDFFGGDFEQPDVVIAVASVRGNQQALAVRGKFIRGK